jgi:tetratricopeptide (TPR) repeat protein/predicted aspartyl protease
VKLRCLATAAALVAPFLSASVGAECVIGKIAELPVTMIGLRPTVPVTINGVETRMTVDSGAFYSLISPGSAAQFGLQKQPLPMGYTATGFNGEIQLSLTTAKTLALAGQTLNNVDFIVGGSEIGSAGFIGHNILGFADVEYDLPDGAVRLMKPRGCGKANFAYWANGKPWSVVNIEPANSSSRTTGTVVLNGVKLKALFDTGSPTSILSLAGAARVGVKPGDPGVVPMGLEGGVGSKVVKTWIAPFASLQIGDNETIQKIRLRIGAVDTGDADMLIGADFFLSHRVYVANSERKMFFTYVGGPVFNLTSGERSTIAATNAAVPTGPDPTDSDGFSRRAQIAVARRDYSRAIADLGHAIALAPQEPRYLELRAAAFLNNNQIDLAMADVDQGLKLNPNDVEMLMLRARLRATKGDIATVAHLIASDFDAADRAAAPQSDLRFAIGNGYEVLVEAAGKQQFYDSALKQFELWLKYHPDDLNLPNVLNSRCWLRAVTGRELDKALADCNRSLRLRPKMANVLDSRGLVQLRLGAFDQAITDYDAAITIEPRAAMSLYGRGIAKERTGDAAGAKADFAAAMAINPKTADRFSRFGVAAASAAKGLSAP